MIDVFTQIILRFEKKALDDVYAEILRNARDLYIQNYKGEVPYAPITGKDYSRDDYLCCLAALFIERYVYHKLVPLILYYDKPIQCVRWIKRQLKGMNRQQAEFVKDAMLQVLKQSERFSDLGEQKGHQIGELIQYVIEELTHFDTDKFDALPLSDYVDWMMFFSDTPEYQARHASYGEGTPEELWSAYSLFDIKYIPQNDEIVKYNAGMFQVVPHELYYHAPVFEIVATPTEGVLQNREHTRHRKVLAMYYIFNSLNVNQSSLYKEKANLIQFLISQNYKNIYDSIRNPLLTPKEKNGKKSKYRVEDIQYVRPFFEKLGLTEIVKEIDKDIKDLKHEK